ncbi:MAG: methyltransferase domain-containing protein [Burkholderiales bacterium]|nr:methyltransferase domain-containing protein [Burkholderiales bacterium]MDE1925771.1 class I SAM-dependent methyltransferase [Burkholderiales bacterium]
MRIADKVLQARKLISLIADLNRGIKDVPIILEIDAYVAQYRADVAGLKSSSTLDIGCGGNPRNPFRADHVYGLDIRGDGRGNIRYADLTVEPIPFPDNSFEFLTAYDFLEHVPRVIYAPERRFPFVELMNEIWRVLKPNGVLLSSTPTFPFSEAFRDPTHVNIISHETFPMYFDDVNRHAAMYGFRGSFNVIGQARREFNLVSLLRKSEACI